jgi:hypothetical protein
MHYLPWNVPDEAIAALQPAFDRSDSFSAEYWVQRARDDTAAIWRVGDVWAVIEICPLKDGLGLHFVGLACPPGQFTTEVIEEAEAWGKSKGCKRSYFTGRRGWAKKLPDYTEQAIVCAKEL